MPKRLVTLKKPGTLQIPKRLVTSQTLKKPGT